MTHGASLFSNPFQQWLSITSTLTNMFLLEPGAGGASAPAAGSMTETHPGYSLFIPSLLAGEPRGLVVMLHGAMQDPADFAAGTAMNEAAQEQGLIVLYPEQAGSANPQRCWNWFDVKSHAKGTGEPAHIAALTLQVVERFSLDPQRVYVAGMSAGGAMATLVGTLYPEIYAAVGVHSGLASHVACDVSSALAAMRGEVRPVKGTPSGMPTIVFHGDADRTVDLLNSDDIIEAAVLVDAIVTEERMTGADGYACTQRVHRNNEGTLLAEHWILHNGRHAWSGGSNAGTFADPFGPDASREMLRFFSGFALRQAPQ
ncbi:PHB depolymerase family esterase [Variovorax sp. J22R133]|uniref:extracellular catalytic domain type 1 short-chain-length polyhydroxyalkanoate depolymerase n=1 Tax=Variovorax brevis TaxID=3053503 RepID=UPI0025770F12|nr:PHB depolymerase family esterase [Variovorax sp. J22R133]MDM0111377.1 PHB depolymerase family esterase [Variovorax sp. J22R133]